MDRIHGILRVAGSLWFAAVLLVVFMLTMACATVFESAHGTEPALAAFYHAWWFKFLLVLTGVNLLAAVVLRYPFTRRQIGFILTHIGIVVTLAGALVTDLFGINGQLGIAEGQTAREFTVDGDALVVHGGRTHAHGSIDLNAKAFSGLEAVENPRLKTLSVGDVERVEILRYLPDLVWEEEVLNDAAAPQEAVELSLSTTGKDNPTWLMAGQSVRLGSVSAIFRVASDQEELNRLLSPPSKEGSNSKGTVRVEYAGKKYDFSYEECLDDPVPLGETGCTLKVLRYLPHAIVGGDKKLISKSDNPVNPAIEAEITGPEGTEKRYAFAKFPNFGSMHGKSQLEGLKLNFIASDSQRSGVPVQLFGGPDGDLHVRFSWGSAPPVALKLQAGQPVETPWPDKKLAVLRRFDHARIQKNAVQPNPIRMNRVPALLVKVTAQGKTSEVWVQKYRPRSVSAGGAFYELSYGEKQIPLGFETKLNRFRIGYYPGGESKRSFESHITVTDPATGRVQDRIVSMNHPAKHGAYTLYQSSYRQERDRSITFLSVSWDPGQPIAFAGYIATAIGMLLVLVLRMKERRQDAQPKTSEQT